MKKICTVVTAALLFTGSAFAHEGKKCGKGKDCCNKKECSKKSAESKPAKNSVSFKKA